MNGLRIIKRLSNLTPHEERGLAKLFKSNKTLIKAITDYLAKSIVSVDKILYNPKELYKKQDSTNYIHCILSERATLLRLHNLLTEDVDLLDDDQKGE